MKKDETPGAGANPAHKFPEARPPRGKNPPASVMIPIGDDQKRPGDEIGLPEDLRVMHAEERNPHDG